MMFLAAETHIAIPDSKWPWLAGGAVTAVTIGIILYMLLRRYSR